MFTTGTIIICGQIIPNLLFLGISHAKRSQDIIHCFQFHVIGFRGAGFVPGFQVSVLVAVFFIYILYIIPTKRSYEQVKWQVFWLKVAQLFSSIWFNAPETDYDCWWPLPQHFNSSSHYWLLASLSQNIYSSVRVWLCQIVLNLGHPVCGLPDCRVQSEIFSNMFLLS